MKIAIYSLILLFIFNDCQGRGLPPHPSAPKSLFETKSKSVNNTVNSDSNLSKEKEDYPTLKLKGKSLKKNSSFANIPIINKITTSLLPYINNIPILRDIKKLLPISSKVAKTRLKKQYKVTSTESFSGGAVVDGLDIGMVRLGQSSHYTRLIFDSYQWEGYAQLPIRKVQDSGTYIFTYEPKHKRITAILDGYQAFSALVGDHEDLYEGNNMVRTIHLDEYLDKSGFKFTIELKQEADIRVYEIHNPARIIIDMVPLSEA